MKGKSIQRFLYFFYNIDRGSYVQRSQENKEQVHRKEGYVCQY